MLKIDKEKKIKELEGILEDAKSVYLADFKGMTVEVVSELRKRCREADIHFEVTKNTLLRRAVETTGRTEMLPFIAGPTAIATSVDDEVAPARVLVGFGNEFKLPQVRSGFVAGRVFDENEVMVLSMLPPKEILLGNVLRALQGPLTNFVSVLQAPLRSLANLLDQVAQQKGTA